MKSVYTKVLVWCFGSLLFSLLAMFGIGWYLSSREMQSSNGPFRRFDAYKIDEAVRSYQSGGSVALADELAKLKRYFDADEYLTDSRGRDLASGVDRSALLGLARRSPQRVEGHMVSVVSEKSGRYYLIVFWPPPPFQFTTILPYYGLILLVLAGLCWVLAVHIATPLRHLARTVDRFGAGDLNARATLERRDEIGELARTFNLMAERLQTLLTAERRLLQDISHELRSPLARLSFAAELLRTAADRDAAAAKLRREIDRLAALAGGLLEVTRAEGEFCERNLNEFRLDTLLTDLVEGCQLEAHSRNCELVTSIAAPVALEGNEELLRRAIENVLNNAIRYAPEASRVDVSLQKNGLSAVLTIRDYGSGVPEEALPKIFTPFFRVDDSRNGATGGLGLGLAIAQRAILLHHGEIGAQNANPGLSIRMSIPLSTA